MIDVGFLFELDTPVIVALVVSFYVAAGGQLLHVLFLSTRRGARPFSLVKLYEVLLFVHLLLAAATAATASTAATAWRFFV